MDNNESNNDLREWVECNIYGLHYCLEKIKLISLISEVLERLPSKDREIIMYKQYTHTCSLPHNLASTFGHPVSLIRIEFRYTEQRPSKSSYLKSHTTATPDTFICKYKHASDALTVAAKALSVG